MAEPIDEIHSRKPRRCYLITYSQADLQKFPNRKSFADAVIEAFTFSRSKSSPQHWACCIERHQQQGLHYHMALKLSAPKRWLGCSGKTFLLKPLELFFNTFTNPASDKYAWVGADSAEAISLNDFRWSRELIEWKSFLLLLEGDRVNLPAPKNHFAKDVCIDSDVPVFATSKGIITYRY